ncbi:roadblock/LC7 domain-containing protein [Streptomyces sp. NPDC048290]|uniref:roadblock/LC7 domain-containing protein n=1 Tax=Streptomyces sp. NPDC048290 TaxID=3155811 RepID=UPI00342F529E
MSESAPTPAPTSAPTPAPTSAALAPVALIPHVTGVLLATSDGILADTTDGFTRDQAEGTAAMATSSHSALRATVAAVFGLGEGEDPQIQTHTIVTGHGTIMMVPAGRNATLLIAGTPDMQMGVVIGEATRQVRRLGDKTMSAPARHLGGGPS